MNNPKPHPRPVGHLLNPDTKWVPSSATNIRDRFTAARAAIAKAAKTEQQVKK